MSVSRYHYRQLEGDLQWVKSMGRVEEIDPILEIMAGLWWKLSQAERDMIDGEGPLPVVVVSDEDDLGLVDSLDSPKRVQA